MKEGDRVNFHAVIGEPPTSTDHFIEYIGTIPSASGQVAWITGKAGCVSLEALSIDSSEPAQPVTKEKP